MNATTAIWAGRLALPVGVLLLWETAARAIDEPLVLATVGATARSLWQGVIAGWMLAGLEQTLLALGWTVLIAGAVGTALGMWMGLSDTAGRILSPFLAIGWAAPKIVLYPVFILLFGLGIGSKVGLAVSVSIFPMAAFSAAGFEVVKGAYLKVAASYRLTARATFLRILAPASVPYLVVALRYTFTVGFLGVVLGEMFASAEGLGTQLLAAQGVGDTARMLAIVSVIVILAVMGNFVLYGFERALSKRYGIEGIEPGRDF